MKLWTIGTSKRSIEEFLSLLEAYQIEVIADVRRFPTSKFKRFQQENLEASLNHRGIVYHHIVELGGYRKGGYKKYMETEDFDKGPIATGLPGSKYGEENTGEICACGPQVMKAYLDQPEETTETLKKWDGRTWLLTGDIGYMNEDGTVAIRDRKKQLIKVAGHSVYPKEVESFLMEHEAVSEAAVAGLPDPAGKVGEIIKAWVELAPGYEGKITPEELKAWTEQNLTKWKCPTIIEFIPEVPKSVLGKVQRRALQEADPLWKK